MYELIHANCIDVLRTMQDKSIDCIVADPPYGVDIEYADYIDDVTNLKRLIETALPEMRRVAERVVLTCGTRNIHLYPQPSWILAWLFFANHCSSWGFSSWQPVLVYGTDPDSKLRMRRGDTIRAYSHPSHRREEVNHPCPKPLHFMRKLINRVAPSPADVILDPFMGSGTTGVAAIQLGHKFIGIEINGDYLAIAKRRIALASPDFQPRAEDTIHEST